MRVTPALWLDALPDGLAIVPRSMLEKNLGLSPETVDFLAAGGSHYIEAQAARLQQEDIETEERPVQTKSLRDCNSSEEGPTTEVQACIAGAEAMAKRIAELEAALRPLARACCTEFGTCDGESDDASVYGGEDDSPITFGIIRNALRALGELD